MSALDQIRHAGMGAGMQKAIEKFAAKLNISIDDAEKMVNS